MNKSFLFVGIVCVLVAIATAFMTYTLVMSIGTPTKEELKQYQEKQLVYNMEEIY